MKAFKCPFDDKKYITKQALYDHLEAKHKDSIPPDMSVAQFYFNLRNKKTHGTCVICGKETKWNEVVERYERFCSKKCVDKYRDIFKKRMIDKYGKVHLLDDPEQQKKMLSNRKISGEYIWSDNKTKTKYTGSYEKDFLKFLDVFMNFNPTDIIGPAPQVFYYDDNEGVRRFYVPDFFIPSLSLIIEVKDGQDNPNNHPKIVEVDKEKEKIKDEIMKKQKDYNYLKIINKDYSLFLKFLIDLKNEKVEVDL